MSSNPNRPCATPSVGELARELGLGVLALIGIGIVVAAAIVGLILLLYAPR